MQDTAIEQQLVTINYNFIKTNKSKLFRLKSIKCNAISQILARLYLPHCSERFY